MPAKCVAVIGGLLLAAVAQGAGLDDGLAAAMDAGDECRGGAGDEACALNEMQLRGQKASTAANPIYCKYLPPNMQSPWCNPAVNTCGCKQYCVASVAPANWGWDPNCCLCGPGVQPNIASKPAPSDDLGAGPGDAAGFHPMAHPVYCGSLTSGVSSPWCAPGVNTCACHSYCTASVRPQDWGWDPNCCACGGGAPPHADGGSCAAFGCVGYIPGHSCQCDAECRDHNNCCGDFQAKCAR